MMTSSWRTCKWGDIATIEYGKSLRGYQEAAGIYRVYGTNGPIGWHTEPLCFHPTVIIGRKGAYRGIHYSPVPCFAIDTAFYLEPGEDIDIRWAYYCLLTYDINSMDSGSAIPSTSREAFYNLPVQIPPKPEQLAIANVLGTLDDKIELNDRMNQTLESIASSIFKSWFVDFDPVRAKMDGRQPEGMDAEIAALFPDSFEDSPIGKIPKGWRTTTIAELTEINALSLTKEDPLAFVEYIEISAVSQGNVGNIVEYARGTEPSRARRRVRHGDTVLSTVRPERRAFFLVLNPSQQLIVSTGFAVISPSITPWSYIHAALTQPDLSLHLGQLADGGAYPAINPNVIGSWEVCSPCTPAVLDSFHNICAPLYERADNNRRECRVLADIRDALLPKLISGEIMVKDADKFVEEHAC
jgi:type I restriction enzyme S subunit